MSILAIFDTLSRKSSEIHTEWVYSFNFIIVTKHFSTKPIKTMSYNLSYYSKSFLMTIMLWNSAKIKPRQYILTVSLVTSPGIITHLTRSYSLSNKFGEVEALKKGTLPTGVDNISAELIDSFIPEFLKWTLPSLNLGKSITAVPVKTRTDCKQFRFR